MPPANWRLPSGVNHALWDYAHNPNLAQSYDSQLAGTPLLNADFEFAKRHFPNPGRLIDLGCGTGRLAVPFAQNGHWTVAVDLSEEMLRTTGAKATASDANVHRINANIVDLGFLNDESFDYAACLFSTFGMVMGRNARRRMLQHVHRILRPGGIFVLHVHNLWFNAWNRRGRCWLLGDIWKRLRRNETAGDCVMPTHLGVTGLTLHLFTSREIRALLRAERFRIIEMKSISLAEDGRLRHSWWFGWLRAYGYLIAAVRD